jgi:hypothetical protein
MGKKIWVRNRNPGKQPRSYYRELRNNFLGLKYLNSLMRVRDPGCEKYGSGMEKFWIQDGKNSDLVSGMEKF